MNTPTQPRPHTRTRHRPGWRPYPHPAPPPPRRARAVAMVLAKAVAAAVALAVLLVGFPAVLIAAAGWPLPHTIPTGDQVRDLLTGPSIPDTILINTLACV